MTPRLNSYVALCVGVLFCLIGVATYYQVTTVEKLPSPDILDALKAHLHTPLLSILDICGIFFTVLLIFAARQVTQIQEDSVGHAARLQSAHHEQLDALIVRNNELERQNEDMTEGHREYMLRVNRLEQEGVELQQKFTTEVKRLTEEVYHGLESQVEAHTLQLEAVNLALQYQRAEIKQVRQSLRLDFTANGTMRLSPEEAPTIHDEPVGLIEAFAAGEPETESAEEDTSKSAAWDFDGGAAIRERRGLQLGGDVIAPNSPPADSGPYVKLVLDRAETGAGADTDTALTPSHTADVYIAVPEVRPEDFAPIGGSAAKRDGADLGGSDRKPAARRRDRNGRDDDGPANSSETTAETRTAR